jgi:hypothetical protein
MQRLNALPTSASYITVTLSGVPSGFEIQNGVYKGWCSDDSTAQLFLSAAALPYSTYNPNLPANAQNPNWPKVNYILNNKQGTFRDIQRAIWLVLRGTAAYFPDTPAVSGMVSSANTLGAAFLPSPGQMQAVLMYQDGFGLNQDTIIEVPVGECGVLGDSVWQDINRDGIQNDGNSGINNVVLRLFNASGQQIGQTTTVPHPVSGLNGYYTFNGLCGSGYTVQVDASTVPSTLVPTVNAVGSDRSTDSSTAFVTTNLPDKAQDLTLDFGFAPACAASLGNLVWHDANRNGRQDPGEPGIPGVTLTLTNGIDSQSTTTAPNGMYGFTGLCPGTYSVSVLQSTMPWATFVPTVAGAAGTTAVNDSNTQPAGTTLNSGSSTDLSLDFGYVSGVGCTLTQGYWKNHAEIWPVLTLTLGAHVYAQSELLKILSTPVRGDDSVRLAHQLIAAKLNLHNGASPSSVPEVVIHADKILSRYSGRIPLGVSNTEMVPVAVQLDAYNNGKFYEADHCN